MKYFIGTDRTGRIVSSASNGVQGLAEMEMPIEYNEDELYDWRLENGKPVYDPIVPEVQESTQGGYTITDAEADIKMMMNAMVELAGMIKAVE